MTCGQNREEGGIFDYWVVPASLASDVFAEIQTLVDGQADGEVEFPGSGYVRVSPLSASARLKGHDLCA
ncbi:MULTISPECIES: DUF6196 family protein [Pseudomonas]|uniref:DUF6196 family protein n=1 Tax=unclassified Pseudomonas TaxID=196821 RepID=UPI003531E64D